jgi:hypothetical protein
VQFPSHVQAHRYREVTSQQVIRSVEVAQRLGMSHGIEVRFPFLDRDLVAFVLTIPYRLWPAPGPYARLHRDALADLLPPAVAARTSKAEFTPALLNRIVRAEPEVRQLLATDGDGWVSERYVPLARARRLVGEVMAARAGAGAGAGAGTGDRRARWVWAIVTLEAWMRAILRYDGDP